MYQFTIKSKTRYKLITVGEGLESQRISSKYKDIRIIVRGTSEERQTQDKDTMVRPTYPLIGIYNNFRLFFN